MQLQSFDFKRQKRNFHFPLVWSELSFIHIVYLYVKRTQRHKAKELAISSVKPENITEVVETDLLLSPSLLSHGDTLI